MPSRKSNAEDVLQASESFSGTMDDGTTLSFTAGQTRIRASHPAVKKWPDYFEPIEVHYDVEQATAAPGEKRGN